MNTTRTKELVVEVGRYKSSLQSVNISQLNTEVVQSHKYLYLYQKLDGYIYLYDLSEQFLSSFFKMFSVIMHYVSYNNSHNLIREVQNHWATQFLIRSEIARLVAHQYLCGEKKCAHFV